MKCMAPFHRFRKHEDAFIVDQVYLQAIYKINGFRGFRALLDPDVADAAVEGVPYAFRGLIRRGHDVNPVHFSGKFRDAPIAFFAVQVFCIRIYRINLISVFPQVFVDTPAEFFRVSRYPCNGKFPRLKKGMNIC